eukprot:jgi/Chrzof1/8428/Cz03g10100.t1
MGANASTEAAEPGIVTVSTSSSVQTVPGLDPLLQHLQALRGQVPNLDTKLDKKDPESVWKDIEVAKELGKDTRVLSASVSDLLSAYQAGHVEHAQAVTTNQAYIHRTIDQAEVKAAKASQHIKLQTTRLKQLTSALKDANGLPALLQQLTDQTADLQARLHKLEDQCTAKDAVCSGKPGSREAPS